MKTRIVLSIMLAVLIVLLVDCQKNGNPVTPDTTPPSAVYAKSIKASPDPSDNGDLTLSWGASTDNKSGVAFYKVHVVCYDNLGSYSNIFKPTTNSLPLSGLPGGNYVVDITAVDREGNESDGPLPRNGDFWSSASFQVLAH